IMFVLLLAIILALPSLLGLLKYEFVWGGLSITMAFYLLLGTSFYWFSKSRLFRAIGLQDSEWLKILALFMSVILAVWIYYLVFSKVNNLGYTHWAMCTVLWFMVPPFYVFARDLFLKIPSRFYKLWVVETDATDEEYWNRVDTFRLMQVNVKIKRTADSKQYASFSVKLPDDVSLGRWFNRFIEDQNIRFPDNTIQVGNEYGDFGWILYTSRWLPIPIATRMLDFEKDAKSNRIKNKSTFYVRRVTQSKEDDSVKQ
ncbi:MAG: TssN family type VI secretion system protein, partial [Bacteroidales bacterium]|nr:TssN family type VI secretion system protein [Bacteroidales bacterium]